MELKQQQRAYLILRIAVAMCFIGHGAFGIITKPIWCNYFAVFGIGKELSYQLMPVVGTVDILLGIIMLVYPMRAIPAWLIFWGFMTAMLRPLSGEPFAESIERAGNYGAPLALLLLVGAPSNFKGWFTRMILPQSITEKRVIKFTWCLRIVVFLLLLGHGWLNMIEKQGLLNQYSSLGFQDARQVAHTVGIFEIIAALTSLIRPMGSFLLVFFIWKMASEVFYPLYGFLEWVERAGSYASILVLWLVTTKRPYFNPLIKHPIPDRISK